MPSKYQIGDVIFSEDGETLLYGWLDAEEAIKALEDFFDETIVLSDIQDGLHEYWKFVPCHNNPEGHPGHSRNFQIVMYTQSTHLKNVSIFFRISIMKNEYWVIGIILAAMCLILYSHINDSISNYRSFKVNMKQIEVINDSNRRLSELVNGITKESLNSADTIKAICQQNEEIRQNNNKLTKQNRLLLSTANALTEENEYLRKVLKQHDIELDLKDKQ